MPQLNEFNWLFLLEKFFLMIVLMIFLLSWNYNSKFKKLSLLKYFFFKILN